MGEEVLLDTGSGDYFGMNPVGTFIWTQLREGTALEEIADSVANEFEIETEKAHADISDFIKSLKKLGLFHSDAI